MKKNINIIFILTLFITYTIGIRYAHCEDLYTELNEYFIIGVNINNIFYKTSIDNFFNLSNKINNRMDSLFDYSIFDKKSYINKYRNPSYNYLLVKSMDDNRELFEYDYNPLKSKRSISRNWFEIYEGEIKQKEDGNFGSFKFENSGFVFGKEIIYEKSSVLGAAFNYSFKKNKNSNENMDLNTFGLSVYSRYNIANNLLYFDGIFSYMFNLLKEKNIIINNEYNSNQFSTSVSMGLNSDFVALQTGINYNFFMVDSYDDIYGNSVDKSNYDSVIAFGNLLFKNFTNIEFDNLKIKPRLFTKLNYTIKKPTVEIPINFEDGIKIKSKFNIKNTIILQYGGDVGFEICDTLNIITSYATIFAEKYNSKEFSLKIGLVW